MGMAVVMEIDKAEINPSPRGYKIGGSPWGMRCLNTSFEATPKLDAEMLAMTTSSCSPTKQFASAREMTRNVSSDELVREISK